MIDQPRYQAGLIADFMQVAEVPPDIGVGNFANQREHRRIHGIGVEQCGGGVETVAGDYG